MVLQVNFDALLLAIQRMGAELVAFDSRSRSAPLDSIDIELKHGIEIDIEEVNTSAGLLNYEGRQVLVYIQDHSGKVRAATYDGKKGNKFHLVDCSTLKSMRERGRFQRYVATNNLDGSFFITGTDWDTGEFIEDFAKLVVCQNCLSSLNYKGATHKNRKKISQEFKIEEFFSIYSSFFSHMPKREAGNADEENYSPDWTKISSRIKADNKFCCSQCGVKLEDHKSFLHVHHRNGVKGDNSLSNLLVLCVLCHRLQPSHNHMFVKHKATQLINQLRKKQQIISRDSWDLAFKFCDPGLHGVLEICKYKNTKIPDISITIPSTGDPNHATIELGWPKAKFGVAISENDKKNAITQGWRVVAMNEFLSNSDLYLRLIE